jgi:hypothetical protein
MRNAGAGTTAMKNAVNNPIKVDQARGVLTFLVAQKKLGWGTWIRTKTNRVRVCCATVTPFPNELLSNFNML